jgi:hypothetical protein
MLQARLCACSTRIAAGNPFLVVPIDAPTTCLYHRLTELKLSGLTLQEQALTALSGPAAIPSLKLLVLDDVTLTNPVRVCGANIVWVSKGQPVRQ